MSIAPLPATLEHLSGRPFAFYPPIHNIPGNQWLYRRATWTECIVANLDSGEEFSIPRMFLGGVSIATGQEDNVPAMIMELSRELELRNGSILPARRHVIELPVEVTDYREDPFTPRTGRRAPVVSIRLEQPLEPTAGRFTGKSVAAAVVLGIVAITFVVNIARQTRRESDPASVSGVWHKLGSADDYAAVLSKLGAPNQERTLEDKGESTRVLVYPALRFSVVLKGPSRAGQRYAETVDFRGRVLDPQLTGPPGTR